MNKYLIGTLLFDKIEKDICVVLEHIECGREKLFYPISKRFAVMIILDMEFDIICKVKR